MAPDDEPLPSLDFIAHFLARAQGDTGTGPGGQPGQQGPRMPRARAPSESSTASASAATRLSNFTSLASLAAGLTSASGGSAGSPPPPTTFPVQWGLHPGATLYGALAQQQQQQLHPLMQSPPHVESQDTEEDH